VLIDAVPKMLWVGIEVIWNRGLREDRNATSGGKFSSIQSRRPMIRMATRGAGVED
jgi:hypothetical protein